MIPLVIEHATRRLGPPPGVSGDDCSHLSIRDIRDEATGANFMWSAWEPTPAELALLNAGAKVYLRIGGVSHPMVGLAVGTHIEGDPAPGTQGDGT